MKKALTLNQGATLLREGGIVAYPTETFYGLAARADLPQAVEKIYDIKNREKGKPISIIIGLLEDLNPWVVGLGEREKALIRHFWPGPLTLVFKARKSVSPILTGGFKTIGARLPSSALARNLALKAGGAITATSANLSGKPATLSGTAVLRQLGSRIDGVVSGKKLSSSKGSTILDVSQKKLVIIREGEVSSAKIEAFLKRSH